MANIDIVKNVIAEGTKDLIRQKPIDSITVTEICDKVNLNRRSFYRYFRDKFEVVDWIYYHDALLESEHYEGWSIFDYMPRIIESLYRDRHYYVNALRYSGQNSFREYCTKHLRNLIVPSYKDVFADEQELELFVHYVCEMTYDAMIAWLSQEPCMPPEQYTEKYRAFLTNAFTTSEKLLNRGPMEKAPIQYTFAEPAKRKSTARKPRGAQQK